MDPKLLNPLIHIGYHKTASTWLQMSLFDYVDRGFFPVYDDESKEKLKCFKSQVFARNFIYSKDDHICWPYEFPTEAIKEKLAQCLVRGPGVPVISHEDLSGSPHAGGFDSRNICRHLSEVFEHPKILIVIREQKSLILSLYFQYLRWGGGLSLKNYLQQPYDGLVPVFDKRTFLFHNLISMYRDTFGKDKVLVLTYEMFKKEPEQFMKRLSGFSGADLPDSLPFKQKINVHPGRWLDAKLRHTNYFFRKTTLNANSALYLGKFFFKAERSIRKRLKWLVPEFLENNFSRKQAGIIEDLIGDYYQESNRKTEKLSDLDLKKYGYS